MSNTEDPVEFINKSIEEDIGYITRINEDIKGSVRIDANVDGTYTLRIHNGSKDKATMVKNIDKDKLLSLIENNL